MSRLPALLLSCLLAASGLGQPGERPAPPPEDTPALPAEEAPVLEGEPPFPPQPINDWLAAQVELHRRGFSCGSIDGVRGLQTAAALKAFQKNEGLRETGELDRATKEVLLLTAPVLADYIVTAADLGSVSIVPDTWLGKSQVDALRHNTTLEMLAERFRANPKLLVKLNPEVNWDDLLPGTMLVVPSAEALLAPGKIARIHVYLTEKILQAVDETGRIILHCPVSIARNVDKRPVGELHVVVVIPDPNYTFDPEVFPEVPEAQELGRRLVIPPGPNNPVGVAWVGLDRTGYGIHGTPDPEKVGRTESHGCFRLANWDARVLVRLARTGLPVFVDP
jgi:lipoprotein-anchoring transpeptidase ErfK/SrfK